MIKKRLAHVVRSLIKKSDLAPVEADMIWQWLEQIKAVELWAGLNLSPQEEDMAADSRNLASLVASWMPEDDVLRLDERIGAFTAQNRRKRALVHPEAGAVGEGDLRD